MNEFYKNMCCILMLVSVPSRQNSISLCWHHVNFKTPDLGQKILGIISSKTFLATLCSLGVHVNALNVSSKLVFTVMVCIFQRQLFLVQTSRGPKKAQMKITMQPLHSAHDQQWSTAVSLPQKSGRGKETSYRMIRHKNFLKLWPKPACAEHGDLLQFCCMHGWMFTINI